MGVIRTALLTAAFALVGLCWMAGCQTRHDSPSTADLIDREDRQYAELEDLANRVVQLEQEQEASPLPTPSPTPASVLERDAAIRFECLNIANEEAKAHRRDWTDAFADCVAPLYAAEPTPSPSLTSNEVDIHNVYAEPTPSASPTPAVEIKNNGFYCYANDKNPLRIDVYPCPSPTPEVSTYPIIVEGLLHETWTDCRVINADHEGRTAITCNQTTGADFQVTPAPNVPFGEGSK